MVTNLVISKHSHQRVCPSDHGSRPLGEGLHVCFHVDNLAVVSLLNKRSAKDPLLSHLLWCLFFFSAFYKFHFSAEHIPGISNTAANALSRDNIHLFSLLVPQVLQATVPSSIQELLLLEAPDWTSPRWTSLFCLSLPRDLLPPHLRHNRSGIRQYTAFCWQFWLTPLPLSDLNLCRFVSYLHQQQLSPASVRLYLATLHYLQIVAVGHEVAVCGPGCPTAQPKPVSATPATYHPSHFVVTAQEVVPIPGVISELFVVGCLLSWFFCLFAVWGVHLPIVSCLQLLNVVMGQHPS